MQEISKVVLYFMIYALIGWVWETLFESILQKKFVNRGFLHGPFIPIYAFGALFNVTFVTLIVEWLPSYLVPSLLFIWLYTMIIASTLEYVTSYVLEKAFHTRWWDYSNFPLNLNGRVSVICSIGWGIAGALLWFIVHPFISSNMRNLSDSWKINISIAFVTYFSIDLAMTLKELITLKIIMGQLLVLSKELKGNVVYHIDNIRVEIDQRKVKITEVIGKRKNQLSENINNKQDWFTGSFQEIKNRSGLLFVKARKGVQLSKRQEQLVRQFNSLLETSKKFSRFYIIYPKARSIRFKGLVDVVRKKLKR